MMPTAENLLNSEYLDTKEQLRRYIEPVFYTKKNICNQDPRKTQTYIIAFKYLILYSGNNMQNKQDITSDDLAKIYTNINDDEINNDGESVQSLARIADKLKAFIGSKKIIKGTNKGYITKYYFRTEIGLEFEKRFKKDKEFKPLQEIFIEILEEICTDYNNAQQPNTKLIVPGGDIPPFDKEPYYKIQQDLN